MASEIIQRYKSPNYYPRDGAKVDSIIIHHTGGKLAGGITWMCSRESRVSAHYLIGRDGAIYQLVDDENAAWHAGHSSWNYDGIKANGRAINKRSIGIELEGVEPTVWQMGALLTLVVELMKRYGIPNYQVLGHKEIAPGRKVDPVFDMDRFREKLPI